MKRPCGILLVVITGACTSGAGPEPNATTLERGMWRIDTEFGTPRVDGLSVDELRRQLPADISKTECAQPVLRSGARVVELVNLRNDACRRTRASVSGGRVSAEGACPGLAAKVAGDTADSWIKIDGSYEPRYVDITVRVVVTATLPSGATQRMTVVGTHKAEKIGEC